MRRDGAVFLHEHAPAGEHDNVRAGRLALDGGGDFSSVHMRHAQIGEDDVERVLALMGSAKGLDAGLAAVGHFSLMAVALENLLHQVTHQGFVVNAQDVQRSGFGLPQKFRDAGIFDVADGENQPHGGALARQAVNFDCALVAFHRAIDHRQAEAGAVLALGGKKRFEAVLAGGFIHADAGVGDFKDDLAGGFPGSCGRRAGDAAANGDDAAGRHRVHGVENQIGQQFADFAFVASQFRQVRLQIRAHFDREAAALGDVAPARTRHADHLFDEAVEVQ